MRFGTARVCIIRHVHWHGVVQGIPIRAIHVRIVVVLARRLRLLLLLIPLAHFRVLQIQLLQILPLLPRRLVIREDECVVCAHVRPIVWTFREAFTVEFLDCEKRPARRELAQKVTAERFARALAIPATTL